jgi:tetratricopeptide (TPR) repeat protein
MIPGYYSRWRHGVRCLVVFPKLYSLGPLFLALSLSVFPYSAVGQQVSGSATIVGQLRVPRSSFPSSVRVLVKLERSGSQVALAYCDNQGRFSFEDLPANLYHVVVQHEGFRTVELAVPVNPLIQHVILLQVDLIPEDKPNDQNSNGELKGSNPALVDEAALLKDYPKEAKKQYEKATKLHAEGKQDEAIEHYQKALKVAPSMYFARNNLGSAYMESKRFDEAEGEFRRVVEENQADANAYFNLANVYLLTKRFDQAIEFIKQGLSRQPRSALGHFLMGSVMLTQGNALEAEHNLRTALNEDPGMANAHLALVNLYLRQKRSADAMNELSTFLKQSPDSSFAPQAREMLRKLQAHRQ